MIIAAARIFTGTEFIGPVAIAIENGEIAEIIPGTPAADITLPDGFIGPGLIDLHNNGAFGVDCATATPAEFAHYVEQLARHGVTGMCPTIITAPIPALHEAARRIAAAMAEHPALLGLHLEGPFLAPGKRGAHRAEWLRTPADALDELLASDTLRRILRVITLAPELPGALAATARLAAAGAKVSLGHTEADAACMAAAAAAGATLVTHLFNAQSPLHHRAPGAPGVALTDPRLSPCLIADGIHVHPTILALAFAACSRAIAVTDSILLAGAPACGVAEFGGAPARLVEGAAYRADGTLAGAAITLDDGLRRLVAAGVPVENALAAATSRPAAALGMGDRGVLAPGARADLVWWSDDLLVRQVWTAGTANAAPMAPRGTETARTELHDLDQRPTLAIVRAFLAQETAAQAALARVAPSLAALADAVAEKLEAGGRLFYAGAGTSGRLALLDAVECGPTFGVPEGLIIPLLAGGPNAFLAAVEGAEDDTEAAFSALAAHEIGAGDALVGIAASGATPFTLAAVTQARAAGALTGAIVNNAGTPLALAAEIPVVILSGPEIIAGSTRLSAGTAQKIALNILSSTVMIRLGKTHGPHMVDLRASNLKLRNRAIRTTATLAEATPQASEAALAATAWHVKTAILVLRQNLSPAAAREKLIGANGSLRRALALP